MYRADTPNVVRSLKQAGYRTAIIGKLNINPKKAFPFDIQEIASSNFARENLGDYAKYAEAYFKADDRPFFLSVNYPDAHKPWLEQVDGLPKKPLGPGEVKALAYFGLDPPTMREAVANYYNCLSRLDSLVGDLLAALERSGKARNTLVIYLGDHGADFLRGKRTSDEGGVRIPLIVRWPKRAKSGQVRKELVSTVDLMPTLLAVAQAEPVDNLPGSSLLPLLLDGPVDWRRYLYTQYHTHAAESNFYPQRTVRNDRYKLIENLMPGQVNPGYGFMNDRFDGIPAAIAAAPPRVRDAYRRMHKPPRFELYDLQSDPYELCSVADEPQHAEALAELQQQLATWRQETNDPLLQLDNLKRLRAEVEGLTKKRAKKHNWGYPTYFFESQRKRQAPERAIPKEESR